MLSDPLLSALARLGPGPVRLWAARKTAERGMHWVALPRAGDDPYVLSVLGLYTLAHDAGGRGGRAEIGRLLAVAALSGTLPESLDPSTLSGAELRRLASAVAPSSPETALALLSPDARIARAACHVAAGDIDAAAAEIGGKDDRESRLLTAHIALTRNDHRQGRRAWNDAFAIDGLAPPLAEEQTSLSAAEFRSQDLPAENGPRISIIVPYRDAGATLGHALDSLTRQSWRNVEILAVDDASEDDGPGIAARAAGHDDRIACLTNERTPGVYGARNSAILRATGDFVTFLDADDWSPPERLARQAEALAEGAATSIANHVRIDESGRPVAPRVFPLARPVPITMMLRREALLSAGLFEEVETGADSEMLARLQMRFGRRSVARDPAILLLARWRSGSLSEAREGGMFGAERLAYRADWMFRHAGLAPPLASVDDRGLETGETRRRGD